MRPFPERNAPADLRPLKYTLCVTQRCNLACAYCYVARNPATMSPETAASVVDFIYRTSPAGRRLDIGFFGGEPLLELGLLERICDLVTTHPRYHPDCVRFCLTSNGTLLNEPVVDFVFRTSLRS